MILMRGEMKTEIAKDIDIAQARIQYDQQCKKVLSNKVILAWILKRTVREYQGISLNRIQDFIESEPEIGIVKVNPGETNQKITGMSTEDKINEEGSIYYDIRFFTRIPGEDERIRLIINIEAQKAFFTGYQLVTRGIYYAARMISAQLGTEFDLPDYDGIQKVYSIWICMNAPSHIGNAISEYHMTKTDIIPGIPEERDAYDKLSVIMVCLNGGKQTDDPFLSMMNTLLDPEIEAEKRKEILKEKYQIPMEYHLGEELSLMCNLSEYVEEIAMEKGIKKGIEKGKLEICIDMVREGILTARKAAEKLGISESEFRKYL